MDKTNKDLFQRVRKCTEFLKHNEIKRENFFDDVYGYIKHSENTRLINRWQCKTADLNFTLKLEKYCENQAKTTKDTKMYMKFIKFLEWYENTGASRIPEDKIEEVFNRFLDAD
jgi:hypothetical protein